MSDEDISKGLCTRSYLLGFTDAKAQQQPSQAFDYQRVRQWALLPNRPRANIAFTAGAERSVAYLIEDYDAQQPSQAVSEDELVELALASGIDCITGLQVRQVIQSLIAAGVIKGA
jgi:hypothetical protein